MQVCSFIKIFILEFLIFLVLALTSTQHQILLATARFVNNMILDCFLSALFFSALGRVSTLYCLFSRHPCQSDKMDLFSSLQACALIHDTQTKNETKLKQNLCLHNFIMLFNPQMFLQFGSRSAS